MPTNQRVSAGSISTSISQMSRTKSSSMGRTRAPRFGAMTTNPSPRSCCSASRTGLVEVPMPTGEIGHLQPLVGPQAPVDDVVPQPLVDRRAVSSRGSAGSGAASRKRANVLMDLF